MANVIIQYIGWHFREQPKAILRAWRNFLLFNLDYWSVALLLKTFFSPWRKYKYAYVKGFDMKKHFEVFTFNVFSRIMGAIMRTILIIIGILSEIFIFFAGIIVLLIWLFLPILILLGILYSITIYV